MLHAVRVVAAGDALVAPSVTRRIIEQFARRRPDPQAGAHLDELTQREREVLVLLIAGVKALACELPAERGVARSRWSGAELARVAVARGIVERISGVTV